MVVQVNNLHLRGEHRAWMPAANVLRQGMGSPERDTGWKPVLLGEKALSRDGQPQATRASARNVSTSASVVAQEHMNRQPPAPMKL